MGAEAPDHEIALVLEHAAQDAGRRGAPEVAADFLEDAARLTPFDAPETRQGRIVGAAEQRFAAGQHARARFLLEGLLAEIPGGPIRAQALAQLGWIRNDDFELGTALLQDALTEAGEDHRLRSQIEAVLAGFHTNLGDFVGQLQHATRAVESAERAGDPAVLARALSEHAMAKFFNGLGIDRPLFDRAIALEGFLEDQITWMLPSTPLAGALGLSDDVGAAMPVHRRVLQRALDLHEECDLGQLLHAAALFEWVRGNVAAAERYAAQSAEVARQQVRRRGERSTCPDRSACSRWG